MNRLVPVISKCLLVHTWDLKWVSEWLTHDTTKKKTYQLKFSICLHFFIEAVFTYSEMLSYEGYSLLNFDECIQFWNDYPIRKIGCFHDPRKVPPAHLKPTRTPHWRPLCGSPYATLTCSLNVIEIESLRIYSVASDFLLTISSHLFFSFIVVLIKYHCFIIF